MVQEKMHLPLLRFSEFNGKWNLSSLSDITSLITKGTTPKRFSSEGVNFVKIESLDGVNIIKSNCLLVDKEINDNELKRSILEENDLLFAIAGATIGKLGIVNKSILPANTNQALAIIRLKDSSSVFFLLQILQSRVMKKYIEMNISVGAQPNLNLQQIGNFSFYAPQLSEQQKIASFLTDVDTKITQLTKKKELIEQYKKGIMQQLFNQELRFKDDDGNDFPEWEEKSLGNLFQFKQGFQFGVEQQSKNRFKDSVEFIRIINVTSDKADKRYVIDPGKEHHINKEDLFMVRYGDAGRVANGFTGIIANNMFRLIPKSKINEQFYFYTLSRLYNKIHTLSGSSTMPAISFGTIDKLKIKSPSIIEQTKIANFLSDIDAKIESVQSQIERSKTFKKGLLQQMFA